MKKEKPGLVDCIVVPTTDGLEWVVYRTDEDYGRVCKLLQEKAVLEPWEMLPQLAIPRANDKLAEAALLEQTWWETGDFEFQRKWLQCLEEYRSVLSTIETHQIARLLKDAELELSAGTDFDRESKLIILKTVLIEVLKERRMSYKDLIRIGIGPKWIDEQGTPHYCDFHPMYAAKVDADECALIAIRCIVCHTEYVVCVSQNATEIKELPTISDQIADKNILHSTLPEVHCCNMDIRKNCEVLKVVQYWKYEPDWCRITYYEIDFIKEDIKDELIVEIEEKEGEQDEQQRGMQGMLFR